MSVELVHIGFGSVLNMRRVLAIVSPDSAPIKRLLHQAKDDGRLIDTTFGRRTKAVVLLDTGHIITAALEPKTLMRRVYDDLQARGGLSE